MEKPSKYRKAKVPNHGHWHGNQRDNRRPPSLQEENDNEDDKQHRL